MFWCWKFSSRNFKALNDLFWWIKSFCQDAFLAVDALQPDFKLFIFQDCLVQGRTPHRSEKGEEPGVRAGAGRGAGAGAGCRDRTGYGEGGGERNGEGKGED